MRRSSSAVKGRNRLAATPVVGRTGVPGLHSSHRVLLVEKRVAGNGKLRHQPLEWRDSEVGELL